MAVVIVAVITAAPAAAEVEIIATTYKEMLGFLRNKGNEVYQLVWKLIDN